VLLRIIVAIAAWNTDCFVWYVLIGAYEPPRQLLLLLLFLLQTNVQLYYKFALSILLNKQTVYQTKEIPTTRQQ